MKLFLLLSILLISARGYTKGMLVEFACQNNSSSKVINVYLNEQGKIVFDPDISKSSPVVCLNKFLMKVRLEVSTFKANYCSTSSDPICNVSADYFNSQVRERISNKSSVTIIDSTQDISTPQKELERRIATGLINPRNLSQTFEYHGKTHKVSDFDGIVGQNIENVFQKMTREEAKQFTQNYLVAKSSIINNRTPTPERSQVLSNLERMFGYVYGESGEEELAKILECAPQDNITTIAEVLKQAAKSEKVSSCIPLQPGKHKVIEDSSPTRFGGDYLLRRTPNGNYQAIVNVSFRQNGSGLVSSAAMMEKVKACLNEASPYIKGPNGETLQYSVLSEEETAKLPSDQRPRRSVISIENARHRSNSKAYAESIDCPTITHEMLHLLGLCDEYKESDSEKFPEMSCRIVPKTNSIMGSHLAAYKDVIGNASVCSCETATCRTILNSGNENLKKLYMGESIYDVLDLRIRNEFCSVYEPQSQISTDYSGKIVSDRGNEFKIEHPQINTSSVSPYYKITRAYIQCNCKGNSACLQEKERVKSALSVIRPTGNCPRGTKFVRSGNAVDPASIFYPELLFKGRPKSNKSLLLPNHFKKILAGNCAGIVDGYNECAKWAYKGYANTTCTPNPQCNDDTYYLGTAQ